MTPTVRWPRPATSCCRWRRARTQRRGDQDFVAIACGAAAADRRVDRRRRACAAAIDRLPDRLAAGDRARLEPALSTRLPRRSSLITIGRGPTLAIAREAALKLKETCNLHAEAFSGAEFLHGPVALVSTRYPILHVHADRRGGARAAASLPPICAPRAPRCFRRAWRARQPAGCRRLPPDHPDTDAICLIQSFYALAVRLAAQARHRRRPAAPPAEGDTHPMSARCSTRSRPTPCSTARSCIATPPS